jgi:hypothetical protein
MNKASAQQLLLLSSSMREEEEEEKCVCALLIKAAGSTWGHRYGAVYTVTSDQHPCHSYDYFVCTFYLHKAL